jgi:hypothetical protein
MSYVVKAASRHLLLAEFILGIFLVAWGACKGVDTMTLRKIISHNVTAQGWILPTLIGLLQACAAAIEWFAPAHTTFSPDATGALVMHRAWTPKRLQWQVAARAWFAGFACVMWAYELKEFVLDPIVLSAVVLILVAPVCCGVNLYSVYANRKVYVALRPDVPTSTITFER